MAVRLNPEDILQPFKLEVTFQVGNRAKTVTLLVEKPIYYREFGEAAMRSIYNSLHTFLETGLTPAPPVPIEGQEETT